MIDFTDLETPVDQLPTRKTPGQQETFPCMKCSGTGIFTYGYYTRRQGKCHACNGRGHFKTSPQQRQKQRTQSAARKQQKIEGALQSFKSEKPEVYDFLAENSSWSDFYRDMLSNIGKYGDLTERQLAAVYKGMAKAEEREAAKKKADDERVTLDLSVVFEKFAAARASGLKKPIMRFQGVTISRAPDHGRNAGHLYVKADGEYAGKVGPEGRWFPVRECPDEVTERLQEVSQDVLAAAVAHGRNLGECCCCGRRLTNQESIDAGIGPICAENWGL